MLLLLSMLVVVSGSWDKALEDEDQHGIITKVHIIYRHGHKEPGDLYASDPNRSFKVWVKGPGQLTYLGKEQGLRLGQNIRSRYASLLPKFKPWKSVKALSSHSDRNLMTSTEVLKGLLNNPEVSWSRQATVYVSRFLCSTIPCPQYSRLMFRLPNVCSSPKLCEAVSKHSEENITTITGMNFLYTTLEIERQAKLTIPEWAKEMYQGIQGEALKNVLKTLSSYELTRLRLGPLIGNFLSKLDEEQQIFLHCTHDNVLGPLLKIFNVPLNKPPDFVSALILEHRSIYGESRVQIWHSLGDSKLPTQVSFPGCGVNCTLSALQKVMFKLVPRYWSKECMVDDGAKVESRRKSGYVVAAISLLVKTLTLLSYL